MLTGATSFNLSLLSSDVYAILSAVFLFHSKVRVPCPSHLTIILIMVALRHMNSSSVYFLCVRFWLLSLFIFCYFSVCLCCHVCCFDSCCLFFLCCCFFTVLIYFLLQLSLWYFVAFALVVLGICLYNVWPPSEYSKAQRLQIEEPYEDSSSEAESIIVPTSS